MPLPTHTQLDQYRHIGDPPADQLIAQLVAEQGLDGAHRLFGRLIREVELPLRELPPSLADFVAAQRASRLELSDATVARAQSLFLDHGPKLLVLLYYQSLPLLYSMANGAEVLVQTGRLDRPEEDWRTFTRRIAETAQFLLAVMQPGGLQPGAEGRTFLTKVRLIHAAIRHFVGQRADWDTERLGEPINQEDLLATLLTFSIAPLDGLARFGIPLESQDEESYQATWTAIGPQLGIQPELLPAGPVDARQYLALILERQSAPSEAGRTLTDALVRFGQETLRLEQLQVVPQSLIHFLIGAERAGYLGVAQPYGCLGRVLPHFLGALLRRGEALEERSDAAKRSLFDALSRLTMGGMVAYFDAYKNRRFFIPATLEVFWGLSDDY